MDLVLLAILVTFVVFIARRIAKTTLHKNLALAVVLLSIPLAADLYLTAMGGDPGAGTELLLYWPVDYAYIAVATLLFATLNSLEARANGNEVLIGLGFGLGIAAIWFVLTFFAVLTLHAQLGGVL